MYLFHVMSVDVHCGAVIVLGALPVLTWVC